MKLLNSILLLSLATSAAFGTTPSLSSGSKDRIASAAISGALLGGWAGGFTTMIANAINPALENKKFEVGCFIAGSAGVGALVGAITGYYNTPEKHYEFAKEELSKISQDAGISMLYQTKSEEWIDKLRGLSCPSPYPLVKASVALRAHYDHIIYVKRSISAIFTSDNQALRQEAQEMMEYANTTLALLKAALNAISSEANYFAECSAKAQEESAIAMKTLAAAQVARAANDIYRPNKAG